MPIDEPERSRPGSRRAAVSSGQTARGRVGSAGRAGVRLDQAAAAFYADLRLSPFLRQMLHRSSDLVGGVAGSISLVDPFRGVYTKMAEQGASCRLGQSFPLDEGVTGQVVARRRPVVLSSYHQIRAGHLPTGHAAAHGAVAAIPIWWRGEVIGANVLFAGRQRRFTTGEVDDLELLTQLGAAGIVQAGASDPSLAHLIQERSAPGTGGVDTIVTEVGRHRAVSPAVADIALDLLSRAQQEAGRREPLARLRVALVHGTDGLRMLIHDSGALPPERPDRVDPSAAPAAVQDALSGVGARATVEAVPGWGTLLRVDLPYRPESVGQPAGTPSPFTPSPFTPSPFTPREQQVLARLADGASDREAAATLRISPKTVEKHVGAVLRKTGTTNRTAAVVTALQHGWLSTAPDAGEPSPGPSTAGM